MGACGVPADLGEQLDATRNAAVHRHLVRNPLPAAAARTALTEVLVPAHRATGGKPATSSQSRHW